jgi:hypothetical protein
MDSMEGLVYTMKQKLESPGFRLYLIYWLQDFSDPEKQKEKFCSQERDDCFYSGVDEPIESVFDFYFEPEDVRLGDIFRTADELKYVRRFGKKLREMHSWILKDGKQKDSYYMDSQLWKEVTRLAKEAYGIMMQNEDLEALYEAEKVRSEKAREEEAKKVITPEEEQERRELKLSMNDFFSKWLAEKNKEKAH